MGEIHCISTSTSIHPSIHLIFSNPPQNQSPTYSARLSIHLAASATPSSTLSAFVPWPTAVGGAGLAAGLAADNGGHGGSPLGSVGALGFGGLWALA